MDFFASQDKARRQSGKLVALFFLAVLLIVLSVYAAAAGLALWLDPEMMGPGGGFWNPALFAVTAMAALAVILGGSLYRISSLRSGGGSVATMMGGKPVDPSTRDPLERRLINVVEEMALASGTPVPEIYILPEEGINAFAAGYTPRDAAVAVTRGCLEKLNRDELQGVIAHEFSHILNGDMRLNIRLIGLLNGILLLHLIGLTLVRSLRFARVGRSRGGKNSGGGVVALIFLMGGILMAIGWIGVLIGRWIQASVSRQREFLADAAAVQFTRNPGGIGGALKKIGGTRTGATIQDPHAGECAHLFFASSAKSSFGGGFATHPPLAKRIRAIEPNWDGRYLAAVEKPASPPPLPKQSQPRRSPGEAIPLKPEVLLATIGSMGQNAMPRAVRLIQEIPAGLREAVRETWSAQAVVLALLSQEEPDILSRQEALLRREAGEASYKEWNALRPEIRQLGPEHRLPLAELAIPALRGLSDAQYASFKSLAQKMIAVDQKVSLFEFALEKTVLRQLDTHFSDRVEPKVLFHDINQVSEEAGLLLSALSHCGAKPTLPAFNAGIPRLAGLNSKPGLIAAEKCSWDRIDAALDRISMASLPVKRQFLNAAVFVIASDGKIAPDEGELLRAFAESLDCPMPPLV